ncbi:energy-coupling factor transporter transmembrane component T family protein [Lactobacillus johnsonii]|jgi:energy-coupling factor transport system permease protein|uniref:Energy-coupling factor transporter transmembrane protein EcfT n=2 Tax=Lactobacillus johnsonii TaxID=33959 RepID=A0A9X4XCJ0_LACJH|nr:energy-coupling factor transporter transmembrane component T [Lactobacillus johnsonii]AAS08355.1 ABC transporter permease component [Lactobacillus johnsonii NCC 533]MBF0771243.1 energy-coupling factor transporter transmembrane protein EcfT [Lactobacillus johnsonii]MCF1582882.1 energy-coupling factor transporter transmembrane protein EcfT [Lactobacillus johnsonii]MCI9451226.1 energy-coupling factor transporter transmembrane protein EcfT [Lactobacillus johnsonii]MCT3321981.1 energy-coupling f
MSKIIIGRYIPSNSIVYKMDPRGKIIATFLFIVIIFLANNWLSYFFLSIFTLLAVWATKLKPKVFWDGVKPLIWLILFTSVLQLFFTTGGKVYWQWGIFNISEYGIQNSIFIFIRFVMIILISTVLTLTTTSLEIADGMEWILKPLGYLKVPVAQIALVMSIALRFVPTLLDQAVRIMNAQRARGADFNSGGLIKRIHSIIPILIPLFISSLTVAIDLATAMEARGYREGAKRTRYRVLKWSKYDWINLGYFALLTLILLLTRTY